MSRFRGSPGRANTVQRAYGKYAEDPSLFGFVSICKVLQCELVQWFGDRVQFPSLSCSLAPSGFVEEMPRAWGWHMLCAECVTYHITINPKWSNWLCAYDICSTVWYFFISFLTKWLFFPPFQQANLWRGEMFYKKENKNMH